MFFLSQEDWDDGEGGSKPFLDHLEDLRWMLIKCVAALGISVVAAAIYTKELLSLLQVPLNSELAARGMDRDAFLFTLNVVDPLTITIQTALLAGFAISCPLIFYFLGQFLLPALTRKEKGLLLPAFSFGALLFLGGVCFCYFLVLNPALGFFIDWSMHLGVEPKWPLQRYIAFTLQMLLAFGISFELPLVITLLAKLGIVAPEFLGAYRRQAFIIILVFAALITPTTDPYNLFLLTGPMYILYEISIILAYIVRPRD